MGNDKYLQQRRIQSNLCFRKTIQWDMWRILVTGDWSKGNDRKKKKERKKGKEEIGAR